MAMTGNFWASWQFVLAIGVLTILWVAVLALDELVVRVRARRAVQRFTEERRLEADRDLVPPLSR